MATNTTFIHSQLLVTKGNTLILPNTAVAEIVKYADPETVDNAPDWMLGMIAWRGLKIPLISFESAIGQAKPDFSYNNRIAVLNTLDNSKTLQFFALVTQGIPRLIVVDKDNITTVAVEEEHDFIMANVMVNNINALIPNVDAIEKMLQREGYTVSVHQQEAVAN
jgi:chemosensory pili system protein ChpC